MEETLFKLARAITDTGTDTVSSKGGIYPRCICRNKNGKL